MCGGGNCGERPLWFQRAHWCRAICCCLDEKELFFSVLVIALRYVFEYWSTILPLCAEHTPALDPFAAQRFYQDFQNSGGRKMKWSGGLEGSDTWDCLEFLNWCEDINHGVYILAGKLRPCNESRTVGEKGANIHAWDCFLLFLTAL